MTGSSPLRIAEINQEAVRANIATIKKITGVDTVIAVVKANAYGHGLLAVAQAAVHGGASLLGVADLHEALEVRAGGVTAPVLCWIHGTGVDFNSALDHSIEVGISSLEQLERLAEAAAATGRVATVHLKLDTGLSRNGVGRADWGTVFSRAAELHHSGVIHVRGVFSHLANAGREADLAQGQVFDEALAALAAVGLEPELRHLASTAASLNTPELRYNAVRIGIAVYGLSPYAGVSSAALGLVPVMRLKAEIVATRHVEAGAGVSYGFNYVVEEPTTLALVAMGYADGMPRALNGAGATVTIRGRRYPIVGRIGMDQFIVDLGTPESDIREGEYATLFGDPTAGEPAVEEWAERMNTINYEIVAGIGARVQRVLVQA